MKRMNVYKRTLAALLCALLLCTALCTMPLAVGAEDKPVLTVTTKEQILMAGSIPSSTLDDVSVEGLQPGHTLESVALGIGDHVVIVLAVTVKEGTTDVTDQYELSVVEGACHIVSYEWAYEGNEHYRLCSESDCDKRFGTEGHTYENDCDESCDICGGLREASPHVYGEGTVTKEASVRTEGNTRYICTVCGYVHNEVIPATGLPAGAIVAIVIGCIAVVGGAGFAIYWFVVRKKKSV